MTFKKKRIKCARVFRAFNELQLRYGELLDRSEEIVEIRANVLLKGFELGETFTTDFVCLKKDGSTMVRECVYQKSLLKPSIVKAFAADGFAENLREVRNFDHKASLSYRIRLALSLTPKGVGGLCQSNMTRGLSNAGEDQAIPFSARYRSFNAQTSKQEPMPNVVRFFAIFSSTSSMTAR